MNKKKIISIITIIALMITTVIPALGAAGDGSGATEWPMNINVSEYSLETASYKLGDVKEFEIGYYPANVSGAVIEATRHIEITGPEDVKNFEFSEDKRNTWKDISDFEGNIKIKESTIHYIRAAFGTEGEYTIRFWMTDDKENIVKESKKEIYVSDEGIYVRPNAPTDLKETNNKLVFEWQYNSNKEVKYNFYIDGEKINTEEIAEKKYDVSPFENKFTPGVHTISVTSVLVKANDVKSKVESAPVTIEYVVDEPETTPEAETTTEPETSEVNTTTGANVTEPETSEVNTTTGANVTEPDTSEVNTTTGANVTGPDTPEVNTTTGANVTGPDTPEANTTTVPNTTTAAPSTSIKTTTSAKTTTVASTTTKKLILAKGKIKKASKKAAAKKIKITFKKIKKATSYEVQICKNKKFKKKATITKKVKKTECTFKKLNPNKKYYVRVRAIAKLKSKTVYGKWSSKKRIKLKK